MIDRSLLTSRLEPRPTEYAISMQEDNDLFVSADENEEQLPTLHIEEPTPEDSSSALSSASASSFPNPFGAPSQNITAQGQQKQTTSIFSTSDKKTFSSLFGGPQTHVSAGTASAVLNPFAPAATVSPFASQINAASPFQNTLSASSTQETSAFLAKSTFPSLSAPPKDSIATTTSPFEMKPLDTTNNIPTTSSFQFPTTATSVTSFASPFKALPGPEPVDTLNPIKPTSAPSVPSQKPLFDFSAQTSTFAKSELSEQPSLFSQTQGPLKAPSISNGPSLFDRAGTIILTHPRLLSRPCPIVRPIFFEF